MVGVMQFGTICFVRADQILSLKRLIDLQKTMEMGVPVWRWEIDYAKEGTAPAFRVINLGDDANLAELWLLALRGYEHIVYVEYDMDMNA